MINVLTDARIRSSVSPDTGFVRLADGAGLYLELHANGGRWWRFRYRFDGKQKALSLGVYPEVPLREARDRREAARKLLAAGADPGETRKAEKASRQDSAANSFEAVAREWHAVVHVHKVSPGHADRTLIRLEQDVFPWVGKLPVAEVKAQQLLQTFRRIEARGAIETAHRAKQATGQVFRYAIATGRAESDPTAGLRDALKPVNVEHMAAIVDPKKVGELLRAIAAYRGTPVVRAALKLAALTFVRPGELRQAAWAEFDLEAAEWRIPSVRMKRSVQEKMNGQPHVVPLSRQAVDILKDIQPLTGDGPLVFPAQTKGGRPMSDATIGLALVRMGFPRAEMTGHGFRAMARTLLVERLGVDESIVEAQLAHSVRDSLGRAYNRTTFAEQRKTAMQVPARSNRGSWSGAAATVSAKPDHRASAWGLAGPKKQRRVALVRRVLHIRAPTAATATSSIGHERVGSADRRGAVGGACGETTEGAYSDPVPFGSYVQVDGNSCRVR